jgi:hypothetical protein
MDDNGTREVQRKDGAIRENQGGKGRPDLITPFALTRLAKHYENGAKKYSDRNYEKGMNYSRYTASMFRHLIAWMKGEEEEDHLAALAWNAFSIMHHQELKQDHLDDMPHYLSEKKEVKNDKT